MSARLRNLVAVSLLALSALFFALGAYGGEVTAVLHKAIYICLECIGIG